MATARRIALLLRGINVGTAKRISMSDLAAMVVDLGGSDVRTLLNSGNVVCTATSSATSLADGLTRLIDERLGFHVSVVTRTRPELDAVLEADPLGAIAENPSRYLVTFLDAVPGDAAVERLRALDTGAERWVLEGRELYLWLPSGVAVSVVSTQLAKGVLGVTWTARNWTTVTKIRDAL